MARLTTSLVRTVSFDATGGPVDPNNIGSATIHQHWMEAALTAHCSRSLAEVGKKSENLSAWGFENLGFSANIQLPLLFALSLVMAADYEGVLHIEIVKHYEEMLCSIVGRHFQAVRKAKSNLPASASNKSEVIAVQVVSLQPSQTVFD